MSTHRGSDAGRPVHVQGVAVEEYPPYAPEAARGRIRRIPVVGEDVLREPCQPVTEFGTAELGQLIDDMFATMYVAEGAGLAANQVGVGLRLFVYDCWDDDGFRHVGHIVNPDIEPPDARQRSLVKAEEGCLSVPGPHRELYREDRAVVHGFSKDGEPVTLTGTGYFARCLLHETDHLNGTLYIDKLNRRERNSALKEMAEFMDEVFAERAERAAALAGEGVGAAGPARGEPALGQPAADD